jgi:serine/threonine protein kinase
MAPEAIAGGDVDGRSDLYAVGAVAYFLLTGTPVFRAGTVLEVFAHHLHTEPEPPSQRAGRTFPRDLERVILKCLAKSPSDRFPGASALQRALASCADTTPWHPEQSAEWWAALRRLHATEASVPPAAATGAETAVIDLADRDARSTKAALRAASGVRI